MQSIYLGSASLGAAGHAAVAALAGQLSAQGDGRVSEDNDTESPTKKSRSDGLGILPLQTHQPFRLQVTHSFSAMGLLLLKVTSVLQTWHSVRVI